jgi:transposase
MEKTIFDPWLEEIREANRIFEEKPHISYPQDWQAYNLAQTQEKLLFLELLSELTSQVPPVKRTGPGRPQADLGEMIFACCLKTYLDFSSRRSESDIQLARRLGYLSHVPHFNTILNYLNKPELKSILKHLIEFSAMPVKELEDHFAVDSTGFSTSIFARWNGIRMKHDEKRQYKKAHVMVGVRTNIISSAEVTGGTVSDYTPFPSLLEHTCKNMTVKEVSADMGYNSRMVFGLINEHGAIPFIPFRKSDAGRAKGCAIWRTMFNYFRFHKKEFMRHYHLRSNAESVFSMIKRKQGMHLRSRKEVAQFNELLCKLLVHNICVLIQEIFESGIRIDFHELAEDELMCSAAV